MAIGPFSWVCKIWLYLMVNLRDPETVVIDQGNDQDQDGFPLVHVRRTFTGVLPLPVQFFKWALHRPTSIILSTTAGGTLPPDFTTATSSQPATQNLCPKL